MGRRDVSSDGQDQPAVAGCYGSGLAELDAMLVLVSRQHPHELQERRLVPFASAAENRAALAAAHADAAIVAFSRSFHPTRC